MTQIADTIHDKGTIQEKKVMIYGGVTSIRHQQPTYFGSQPPLVEGRAQDFNSDSSISRDIAASHRELFNKYPYLQQLTTTVYQEAR